MFVRSMFTINLPEAEVWFSTPLALHRRHDHRYPVRIVHSVVIGLKPAATSQGVIAFEPKTHLGEKIHHLALDALLIGPQQGGRIGPTLLGSEKELHRLRIPVVSAVRRRIDPNPSKPLQHLALELI
jgi:hypothetical protein